MLVSVGKEQCFHFYFELTRLVDASIATASAASGKSLYDLMSVEEKWLLLSDEIQQLRFQELSAQDEYYDFIDKEANKEKRKAKKQNMVIVSLLSP